MLLSCLAFAGACGDDAGAPLETVVVLKGGGGAGGQLTAGAASGGGDGVTAGAGGQPGLSGRGGQSAQAGQGGQPAQAGQGGQPAQAGQGGQSVQAGQGGAAAQAGQGGAAARSGQGGQSAQAGQGGQSAQAGEGGQSAQAGEGGQAAQAGQGGAGQGGAGAGQGGAAAGQGGAAGCPADMVAIGGDVCMDRYEAPNQLMALPLAMQSALDGEAWCEAAGKRLCTELEWIGACEGPEGLAYPYGATYVEHRCNDDKTWKVPDWGALATWPSDEAKAEAAALYQGDPSGSREGCVSAYGVFDMTGNVAEWVRRSLPNANNYDHVMKGCYWSKCYGGANPSCSFVNPAHPSGFRSYEAGFRCCVGGSG